MCGKSIEDNRRDPICDTIRRFRGIDDRETVRRLASEVEKPSTDLLVKCSSLGLKATAASCGISSAEPDLDRQVQDDGQVRTSISQEQLVQGVDSLQSDLPRYPLVDTGAVGEAIG